MGHDLIENYRGRDQKFTVDELKKVFFNGKNKLYEIVKDDLLILCKTERYRSYTSFYVRSSDIAKACELLSAWDGKML